MTCWQSFTAHPLNLYARPCASPLGTAPDPDDVARAAFVKYAALKDTSHVHNPKAYLFTMARNIVMDHKRKDKSNDSYVAEQLAIDSGFQFEVCPSSEHLAQTER